MNNQASKREENPMTQKDIQLQEITDKTNPVYRKWMTDLYTRYLEKLKPYNADLKDKGMEDLELIANEEVTNAVEIPDSHLLSISRYNGSGYELTGLAVIGFWGNSYGEDDLYIQEFFIADSEKKKGYGKQAVADILERYRRESGGKEWDVSLFVLEENFPARLFWKNVMEELGYKDLAGEGKVIPPDTSRFDSGQAEMRFQYWRKAQKG